MGVDVSSERGTPVQTWRGACRDRGGAGAALLIPRWRELSPFGSLRSPPRAMPTETKVESGTSQSKSGTSVNLSNKWKTLNYRAIPTGDV